MNEELMMYKTLFSILIFFGAFAFATDVTGNFRSTVGEPYHFNTNMQFTTDFTLSASSSGDVVSGNPSDLQSGDIICEGATLTANPSVNSKWAVSSLDIDSLFPDCFTGGCPTMISYATTNTNRNIKWITSSQYTDHNNFGDGNPFSQSTSRYNDLATFHYQPATYYNATGTYSNRRIEGNVFCKGTFQVRDGSSVVSGGSSAMPSIPTPSFTVSSTGSHAISTRLSDVECIAAAAKNPLQQSSSLWFYLYYFTSNQPSIASSIATDTITLTVQEAGGTCSFNEINVRAVESLIDEDLIMVIVTEHNSGDPIIIDDVSGSNPGYDVDPLPVSLCDTLLGFPSSECPSSNGFNESVSSGANQDLYVVVQRNSGASGGTVLTFDASTTAEVCGSASSCTDSVAINGPITCEIDPSSLTYGTLEVAEFLVACEDLAGDPISCVGNNWYWDSLSGDFIERDNTHALAYSTSPPGSTGTMNYESGIAHCLSDVTMTSPYYECEFIPPSATMDTGDSEYFELNCFAGGSASTPDDADYDVINGLLGSTSNSSTDGTTFNAGANSTGDLLGYGFWNDPLDDPVLGAIALAEIQIGDGGDNNDSDDDDDDDGSSEWCTIGDGTFSPYPGAFGWLNINCGPDADQPCANVTWSDSGYVDVTGGTDSGTYYNITGEPGDTGTIHAYVDNDPDHSCSLPFSILEPECWEYS
jgi:hypothetical protein